MANPVSGKIQALRVFQGFLPKQLPKGMPIVLDFTGTNGISINIDLEISEQESDLDFVQMVFIDNRLSGQAFTLTSSIIGQTVGIPAGAQGYVPILCPEGAKFVAAVSGVALGIVKIIFMNCPAPAAVWMAQ